MQMVKKLLLFGVVGWLALLLFMPKSELYNTLQRELNRYDIRLNEERIEEGAFDLKVEAITLYLKGIPIATIDHIEVVSYLFYTKVTIKELRLDASLHQQAPSRIEETILVHDITDPLMVYVDINGSLGTVQGGVALQERRVRLDLIEERSVEMIKGHLSKDEEGWYYETHF
jgi:hypothetical protein